MKSEANAGKSGGKQDGGGESASSGITSSGVTSRSIGSSGGILGGDILSEDLSHLSLDQLAADQARVGWLAAQAVRPLPEVRSERIAFLQSAIANGSYQVSPEQIAEAILAEHQARDEAAA